MQSWTGAAKPPRGESFAYCLTFGFSDEYTNMNKEWIILDLETVGLSAPIHAVEAGAQLMSGNSPAGEPFSILLDHGIDVPEASTRIHGYTRDILERDGFPPAEAYASLREYVGSRPVVSYNLAYDWDKVLAPELTRLNVGPVGQRGFCALRLARRLLDPVPAGNCKLQTLRRYYGLPERAAHSAVGDVLTVVDLFRQVLWTLAGQRGLDDWDTLAAFAEEEWYSSRIAFGKHKGRDYREAREDEDLRSWLEWLADSDNERSSRLGAWYLEHLDDEPAPQSFVDDGFSPSSGEDSPPEAPPEEGLVVWTDPEAERLELLVASSRARLAELETAYGILRAKVDETRAHVFKALRPLYEKRSALALRIQYRRSFLDALLQGGEQEAETVEEEFHEAEEETRRGYERAADDLAGKKELSEKDQGRLAKLWKKLVRVFHPDRHHNDPEKRKRYEELTALINRAKEEGDLDALEEIAADPEGYARRRGLGELDLSDRTDAESLRRLWAALQAEILKVIEETEALRESPDHELAMLAEKNDSYLDLVADEQKETLQREIDELTAEADKLGREIEELTGETPFE